MIWKPIKEFEGLYEVSNNGEIKSLWYGKERILKATINTGGYLKVNLCKECKAKTRMIHQLVAESFLNHTPNGYKLVVNHINFIKTDNRVENLEIVTNRENTNRKHLKSNSVFTGVSWHKQKKKWQSQIVINGKQIHLGYFTTELEASEAYQNKLEEINV